jgi:lysophospholipase L1-like esterase
MIVNPMRRRRWLTGVIVAEFLVIGAGLLAQTVSESATESKPRDAGWIRVHESYVEQAKKGKIDLLFLGDSISQGWTSARAVWDRHYRPRNAANFGIGGDRTQHVLWRLEHGAVDGIKPKVVVFMLGTNNLHGNSVDEIVAGDTAIIKKLHEKLPDTKVLLLGIFPRGERAGDPDREKIKSVNERLSKLDDGKTVRYLDIGARFLSPDGSISAEIMPDFLHLSRKGYRIWADAMEPTLWSMLDEK